MSANNIIDTHTHTHTYTHVYEQIPLCTCREYNISMCVCMVCVHGVSYMSATGWRSVIRCLKSQIIFRNRATNYRALLRKMTCDLRHPMTLRHPVYIVSMCVCVVCCI